MQQFYSMGNAYPVLELRDEDIFGVRIDEEAEEEMHMLLSHVLSCRPDANQKRQPTLQCRPTQIIQNTLKTHPRDELRPPRHPESSVRQLQQEHPDHSHSQPSLNHGRYVCCSLL